MQRALLIRMLLLAAALTMPACVSAGSAWQATTASMPAVVLAAAGAAVAGPIGAAVLGGLGAWWGASDQIEAVKADPKHGTSDNPLLPWWVREAKWLAGAAVLVVLLLLWLANRSPYLPDVVRTRRSRRRARDALSSHPA